MVSGTIMTNENTPLTVAHIIKATRIGGAERHLLILLAALRRKGVNAHLILMVQPDNLMTELVTEAEARDIPVQRVLIRAHYDLLVISRLHGALRDLKPDIVHTHLIHADVLGLVAAKLAGVKRVITGRHNDDAFRKHWAISRLNGFLWRIYHGGIAISYAIRNFVMEVENAPEHKVHVVEYGLEHHRLTDEQIKRHRNELRLELELPTEAILLGCAARLTEQKGITYALLAFADILPEYGDAYLVIAGDGELRPSLEKQVRDLGIMERVFFLGWRDDVPTLMAGLDVYLVPSLWEGFGLVLLEAMSRRLPIIASNVSAIPEIVVHGETGLLVPARDVSALAQAMRVLLADRLLRVHYGLNGEDRLEELFSDLRMADDTLEVYRRIMA
jgi:glycosyltransferase involved in cell wall biosynthesis